MKTYKQCFDEDGHTYGKYWAPKYYNLPFEKLREAGIPEQYDHLITNLLMIPTRENLFGHANFAAKVLIELNNNGLFIDHPQGIDYFHYLCQQYSGQAINNYFNEDLSAAVKLFADLIKKGLFVDNFDGLWTIMCGKSEYNDHVKKAELFVAFHEKGLSAYYEVSERIYGQSNTIPVLLILQDMNLLTEFGKPLLETKEIGKTLRKMINNDALLQIMQGCSLSPKQIITILSAYDDTELALLKSKPDILQYAEFLIQFKQIEQAIHVFETLKPHMNDVMQCSSPFNTAVALINFKRNPLQTTYLTAEEITALTLKSHHPEYVLQLLPVLDCLKPYLDTKKSGEMDEIIQACSRHKHEIKLLLELIHVLKKVEPLNIDTFKKMVSYYQLKEKRLSTMIETLYNINVPSTEILDKIDTLMRTSNKIRILLFPNSGKAAINACNYVEIFTEIEKCWCAKMHESAYLVNKISEILNNEVLLQNNQTTLGTIPAATSIVIDKNNASTELAQKPSISLANLVMAQKGNPAFSGKEDSSEKTMEKEEEKDNNQNSCIIS